MTETEGGLIIAAENFEKLDCQTYSLSVSKEKTIYSQIVFSHVIHEGNSVQDKGFLSLLNFSFCTLLGVFVL